MFEKILIANRGDQLSKDGTAAKPNRIAAASRESNFNAEANHV
jgi:hypothetical protein